MNRFASVGVRIGAVVIDGIVAWTLMSPLLFSYVSDVFDDIRAGEDGVGVPYTTSLIVMSLAITAGYAVTTAYFGGSPGKLVLGLRVTTDDGFTSPPGLRRAVLRFLPGVVAFVPVVGVTLGGLLLIAAFVMIVTDDEERRSLYDRIAGTRVVHARTLEQATGV